MQIWKLLLLANLCTALCIAPVSTYSAQFGGDSSVQGGLDEAAQIKTGGDIDIRLSVRGLLLEILSYMGLAAVTVIIIAAIMLVVGVGSEESADRLRKVLLWTLAGFVVIALAGALVSILIEGAVIT